MLKKSQARLVQIWYHCQEKGTDHQPLSEELFQCCDLDDMLIDKYCKDYESRGWKKLWDKTSFFQYISNKAWIRDRPIVVHIIVIMTPLFENRCDKS